MNDAEKDEEIGFIAEPELPGKLERLQKILAQAGVASRRHAENLITEGRVQVNGKVVTELGTKADAARDHIRVDGKLLQGSERLRYYMLNKPKGFVTTVSDPERRPTVMQFFAKLRERLYPVGRLDYLSEGLLLVTNDGDLANKLTRAAAGVEKTYLVKVSGEPTEEELDRLRSGVGIERGKPGSGKVQTAPAQIRKVRQGDNPWYEVVIIEGRNRELRKMFEEIGHHVEKIRRVGYGPLVLDIEPGKIRELEPEELEDLRKAADGKLRKPKSKDKRRDASKAQLPTLKPRVGVPPTAVPEAERPVPSPRPEFPPKKQFGAGRPPRPAGGDFRPRPERAGTGPARFGSSRSGLNEIRSPTFPAATIWHQPPGVEEGIDSVRRSFEAPPRSEQRPAQFGSAPSRQGGQAGGFAGSRRPDGARPFEKKPWKKLDSARPNRPDRPAFKPHAGHGRDAAPPREEVKPPRPSRLHIEPVEPERESPIRPTASRPPTGRPATGRPPFRGAGSDRPTSGRTGQSHPGQFRPRPDRPGQDRSKPDRPVSFRSPRPSTVPAAHDQAADPAAAALGRSELAGLLAPKVIALAPLPPAPASPALAEPDPPTSAPPNQQQENPRGSPGLAADPAALAGLRLQLARNRPSVPASKPGGFSKSGSGYKGSPAEESPGPVLAPAENGLAANAPVAKRADNRRYATIRLRISANPFMIQA